MLLPVLLFLLGLLLLIKGGDWFVDGATGLAHRFGLPELLIGATVVSVGTTLPETMVSAASALTGHGEIAYGNATGSVICNTALIAALTIAILPTKVDKKSFRTPVIFFFLASAVYLFAAYALGGFTRSVGLVLLAIFALYLVLSVRQALRAPGGQAQGAGEDSLPTGKALLLLVVGAALIALGADLLVDNGTLLAQALGVPESVIALTFVALGTSLPELVTAISALLKGHGALSLGNIVGANLFNLVLATGVSATLAPFSIPMEKTFLGYNASLVLDLPLMVFVMAFLTLPALRRGRLTRAQGVVLLIIYAAFCLFQFFF
jgi:cation:H+ antiporter